MKNQSNSTKNSNTSENPAIPSNILKIKNVIICIVLVSFISAPIIQLLTILPTKPLNTDITRGYLFHFQHIIDIINLIILLVTACFLFVIAHYKLYSYITVNTKQTLSAKEKNHAIISRLLPYFIFIIFVIDILLVTVIRGANTCDLHGYWYRHESIFSYMTYALAYFFCGMLLFDKKSKEIILYSIVIVSLPLHIIALIDQWIIDIPYFVNPQGINESDVKIVFFNSNHYGYFLVISILTAALLYVYDNRKAHKCLTALCSILGIIALIINNTFGAYLAILFVLSLFFIYCCIIDKQHRINAAIILTVFLLITIIMSFYYNTVITSFIELFNDIFKIVENPATADSAGSSRWWIWKNTILHIPEHPILGFGVEGLFILYDIMTPHNEFLQYAAFFGIPSMILYMSACFLILSRVFKKCHNMSSMTMIAFFVCIGYLTSSLFGVAMFYTTPYVYIMLGLTYAEYAATGGR